MAQKATRVQQATACFPTPNTKSTRNDRTREDDETHYLLIMFNGMMCLCVYLFYVGLWERWWLWYGRVISGRLMLVMGRVIFVLDVYRGFLRYYYEG